MLGYQCETSRASQKLDDLLAACERQILDQPRASLASLRKESRARIDMFGKLARAALAEARSPDWRNEKASSGEIVVQLMFDTSGERLFAATTVGARVYLWREILESNGEMPAPKFAVSLDPWLKDAPDGTEARDSFAKTRKTSAYRGHGLTSTRPIITRTIRWECQWIRRT
jgi:hypothetical protein